MELFGFASGSSKTGPAFPYMPESVLNSYPNTLMDHPAVPSAGINFLNLQTPDARDLIAVVQTWADKSLELLEKPSVRTIGIGLSASVCAYGAWRMSRRWSSGVVVSKNDRFPPLECEAPPVPEFCLDNGHPVPASLEMDLPDLSTDISQRQLVETQAKLNDIRFQLNRVEGEKDLLAAEVGMRKKIVAQLQGEIHIERDKRRQAELKMEMMEWENTHLRRLRKDVAVKEGKIDMLEASLREKEVLHDKLFHENVILPKNVAAARAKEYENLHAKVQKYEMEAVMKRTTEVPYKPNRPGSVTSSRALTPYGDTSGTLETAVQLETFPENASSESYLLSDWDKSPSSTGSTVQQHPFASSVTTKAKTLIYSTTNWSNSLKTVRENASGDGRDNFSEEGQAKNWKDLEMRAQHPGSLQHYRVRKHGSTHAEARYLNRNGPSVSSKTYSEYSSQPLSCVEKDSGMLGQISSFFSGFNPSDSASGVAATPASPAQLVDVIQSQSRLWDNSPDDKANNCRRHDDGEDEDVCCLSVSDGHSSVFMSASCGSDTSDDDIRDASRSYQYFPRKRSLKRSPSPKKTCKVKSLMPPILAQQEMYYEETKSSRKEYRLEKSPFPKEKSSSGKSSFSRQAASCKRITSLENSPSQEIVFTNEQKKTSRPGRARQRCRLRRSRSKLTTITSKPSKETEPVLEGETSTVQPLPQERLQSNTRKTMHSPKIPEDVRDQAVDNKPQNSNKNSAPSQASADARNQAACHIGDTNKNSAPSQASADARNQAACHIGDTNKNSTDGTDTDSEESWIVLTPAN